MGTHEAGRRMNVAVLSIKLIVQTVLLLVLTEHHAFFILPNSVFQEETQTKISPMLRDLRRDF